MSVLLYRRQTRWVRVTKLSLLLFPTLSRSHDLVCPVLISRVVEKSSNVVNKEGIQKLCDLFLVCEIQGSVIWNPAVS